MMSIRPVVLVMALTLFSGCGAIKEKVGDLEKEALIQSISDSVDKKLEARGLSLATLKSAVDVNGTGKVDPKQATAETVSMAKEAALIEAKRLVDDKIAAINSTHMTRDEWGREREGLWYKIMAGALGLISTYLGKQIVSSRNEAKKHANYHARMSVLEALVGKQDEDEDGEDAPAAPKPPAAA
jgi:hypothetical protein